MARSQGMNKVNVVARDKKGRIWACTVSLDDWFALSMEDAGKKPSRIIEVLSVQIAHENGSWVCPA